MTSKRKIGDVSTAFDDDTLSVSFLKSKVSKKTSCPAEETSKTARRKDGAAAAKAPAHVSGSKKEPTAKGREKIPANPQLTHHASESQFYRESIRLD